LHTGERINISHQMPANTVGVNELLHPCSLVDLIKWIHIDIGALLNLGIGEPQISKDFFVEKLFAAEFVVHPRQEFSTASTLDDSVIIGGSEGNRLANTHINKTAFGSSLELGWVLQRTSGNNATLTGHEARHRVHGADSTWVG